MPSMPLKRKKFPVKFCLPPGYYALKAEKPGIFKTATGRIPRKYSTLDAASISKAEGIAMAGVQISGNPRIKAWEPTDIEKLLPAKHKISDGKLSNFVIDYIFLLIESQSQASNKRVFTVNSDVYNNMAQFSMNIFLKHKYDLLYENISAVDMILCAVLHGDHWCLVAIDSKERRMIYLDSLFNGVGAQTAFTRFAYFLECVFVSQSKVLDWKEWQYYIIPSTEIEQQTNSVDCGVFVVKWAQHIAEGQPLDFSQTQIDDFRYSLILDIANGDGSLSNLATEPGQVSDDQARPFLASSGLTNDCGKANNSSCTNLKGKVQKQHCQIQILTLNLQRKDRKQILVESHLWSVVMTTHMPRMLSSLTFIQEGSRFQSVHKKYFHLVININAMNLEKCPWITLQVHLKIIFM